MTELKSKTVIEIAASAATLVQHFEKQGFNIEDSLVVLNTSINLINNKIAVKMQLDAMDGIKDRLIDDAMKKADEVTKDEPKEEKVKDIKDLN